MKYQKNVNTKIKSLRKKIDLTQKQLANILNVAPSTIGMYEQGRRTPNLDTLIKMSSIFNTSIDMLLGLEEKPYTKSIKIDVIIIDLINFIQNQDCIFLKGKKLHSEEISNILYVLNLIISK